MSLSVLGSVSQSDGSRRRSAAGQFFYDVSKRTSRLMMKGILMSGGWDALVINARRRHEYNTSMLRLYDEKNADPAIAFLLSCYKTQDVRAAENS